MSALGFFRNNTKLVIWIMVVLMVTFLLSTVRMSQWAQLFGRSGSPEVATLETLDLTLHAEDFGQAQRDFALYRQLRLINPIGSAASIQLNNVGELILELMSVEPMEMNGMLYDLKPLSEQDRDLKWTLLVREARALGLKADGPAVDSFLASIGYSGDRLKKLLVQLRGEGVLESQVRESIANFLIVAEAFEAASDGVVRGEAELRQMFRDINNSRKVAFLRFEAADYLDLLELDEDDQTVQAEMETLFQEGRQYYRDAQDNPNRFRFGYRLPQRVQLEYVLVDFNVVESTIVPDEATLYEYFQNHQAQFTKPAAEQDGEPVQLEYPEAKPQVRNRVRAEMAFAQTNSIAAKVLKLAAELQESDAQQETAPAASPLARAVEQSASPALSYFGSGEWLTPDQLRRHPVLQRCYNEKGQQLVDAVFSVDALQDEDQRRNARVRVGRIFPQIFATNGARRGAVVWEVTAAVESQAPEAMDKAIAEQVRADWRLMKAYDIAVEKATQASLNAADKGLDKVADADDLEVKTVEDVVRRGQIHDFSYKVSMARYSARQLLQWFQQPEDQRGELPQQAQPAWYIEAALAQPYIWGPPALREMGNLSMDLRQRVADAVFELPAVQELSTDQAAPTDSLVVIEVPEVRGVLLVQQLNDTPAYEQDLYEDGPGGFSLRDSLLMGEVAAARKALLKQWCDMDNIVARTGFAWKTDQGQTEAEEAEQVEP